MNNRQILDLTLHLSQALDQNYDVVNMDTVFAVISALEGTTITKEQLEATRLAKYINQLRRRTTNESLARRSKSLLKKWREMVGMQQTGLDSQQQQHNSQQAQNSLLGLNASTISNESIASMPTLQHMPRHYATSPVEVTNFEQEFSSKNDNMNEKALNLTTNAVNLARRANINYDPHINRLDTSIEKQKAVSLPSVVSDNGRNSLQQQPPTSFSNLISNLSSGSSKSGNYSNTILSVNENSLPSKTPRNQFSSNKIFEQQHPPETLVIDNSSNSNSVSNFVAITDRSTHVEAPIVIDIDSDSNESDKKSFQSIAPLLNASSAFAPMSSSKTKKTKKDKKRKTRFNPSKVDLTEIHRANTNEELHSSSLHNTNNEQMSTEHPIVSDISEILSISNSSMFPVATTPVGIQKKVHSTTSDLSFAGKFKHINTDVHKNNDNPEISYISDTSNTGKTLKLDAIGMCSNENSISNCQISAEVVNVFNPNNKSNTIDDIRLQNSTIVNSFDGSTTASILAATSVSTTQNEKHLVEDNDIVQAKIPKKRGRKKGSKGVDSIIAKETSLSHQILLGSGGKKVKTTKELFNEIQNRKINQNLNLTQKSTSWGASSSTQLQNQKPNATTSRPTSSCSEPSLQSPHTMDAGTISTLASPENIRDSKEDAAQSVTDSCSSSPSSFEIAKRKSVKRQISIDSNSNSQQVTTLSSSTKPPDSSDVGTQLQEIVKRLPALQTIETIEKIHSEQIVPCTCAIIEEMSNEQSGETDPSIENGVLSIKSEHRNFFNHENLLSDEHGIRNMLAIDVKAVKKQEMSTKDKVQKPKKSIFDLDFDDDEDPLHTLIAETAAAASAVATHTNTLEDKGATETADFITKQENNSLVPFQQADVLENVAPMEHFPSYRIEEDSNCVAKQRYEVQTNRVTAFHVDALHNCYIPNVNGNWDDSITLSKLNADTLEEINEYVITDGSDVVPKYGSLINTRIPKDLSHLKLINNNKVKPYQIPHTLFLGVAKCLRSCRRHKRKTKAIKKQAQFIKDETIEDEDENENNHKICQELTNSTLQIDVCDQNDSEEIAEGIQNPSVDYKNHCLLAIANDLLLPQDQFVCAGNEQQEEEQQISPTKADLDLHMLETSDSSKGKTSSSRRSSSCSTSSLKTTQNCINKKLRQQRISKQNRLESPLNKTCSDQAKILKRKRKKRKKLTGNKQNDMLPPHQYGKKEAHQQIKRIKIAINGDIATQRQITIVRSSDEDDNNSQNMNEECSDTDESQAVTNNMSTDAGSSSSDASDDEHEHYMSSAADSVAGNEELVEEQHENDADTDDEYAVVQRPISDEGSNHIVLTIKKTPSKINSPANSISPMISASGNGNANGNDIGNSHTEMISTNLTPYSGNTDPALIFGYTETKTFDLNNCTVSKDGQGKGLDDARVAAVRPVEQPQLQGYRNQGKRGLRRRVRKLRQPKIDLKNIFGNGSDNDVVKRACQRKTHHKLFFADELYTRDRQGNRIKLFNCSSCESSCAEETEYEYFSSGNHSDTEGATYSMALVTSPQPALKNNTKKVQYEIKKENFVQPGSPSSSSSSSAGESSDESDENDDNSDAVLKSDNSGNEPPLEDDLPLKNNGELPSFNTILAELGIPHRELASLDSMEMAESCDDHTQNNNLNKNIHNLDYGNCIDNSKKLLTTATTSSVCTRDWTTRAGSIVRPEYRTGIRIVNQEEDVKVNNATGNGEIEARIQKFKEWHEVLKLRSYNDELLTVLPYVVLE